MNLQITDAAKAQICSVLAESSKDSIRFGLHGGGCNGFSYYFDLSDPEEDDLSFDVGDGKRLVVDYMSAMYLDGAVIDYKTDIMGSTFVFSNPNTKSQCGCGNSVGF